MKSRALRFTLHVLFVGIVAAAAYVVWKNESEGIAASSAARTFAERAHTAARSLVEIKAAQAGYVAAGQGQDFWIAKVDALLTATRESLAALTAAAQSTASRTDLATATDTLESFQHADRRARDYARNGQRLLASDLIFSDGIEKMDAAVAAIERARAAESDAALGAIGAQRRAEAAAAAGAALAGLLLMLMLVPVPRSAPGAAPAAPAKPEPVVAPPARSRRVPSIAPPSAAAGVPIRPLAAQSAAVAPPSAKPAPSEVDLPAMASLCTDLARILDTRALPSALERAARLLNASGLVIWVADPDGRELAPVLAHGYPANLVSRFSTIAKDAENATAAAFRTGLVQTVRADTASNGAIAAPMLSPAGPVGVMAAEVLNGGERKEATRAAAAIVAAQLATLIGPPSSRAQGKTEAV
jgi:hypothetical protein